MDAADLDTALLGEQVRTATEKLVSLGLFRIEGTLLAITVDTIREVVPGQTNYIPLAGWTDVIIGAISLRGWVIPIFDVRKSLGMRTSALGEHVILVLRLQGRLLGLVADCVCGMAQIKPEDLFELESADGSLHLTTHAFQMGDDVASLLDATRIAGLPNLPTVSERLTSRARQFVKTEKLLLFSYGGRHFGIDAIAVDATVPNSPIDRSQLANGYCLGVVDHQAYATPVLETSAALGFAATSRPAQAPLIVVRFRATAMLGFIVEDVREIAAVPLNSVLPIPYALASTSSLFRGLYTDASGREHLVLDIENLRADTDLATLANLRRPQLGAQSAGSAPPAGHVAATSNGSNMTFLTYVAGTERATLLTQIAEILPYPRNLVPFDCPDAGIIGIFTHQGRAIPLVAIATRQGARCTIDPIHSRVLVTKEEDITIGFVVDTLRSIETAKWNSSVPNTDTPDQKRDALVLVGLGDERRLLQNLDLMVELRRVSVAIQGQSRMAPRRDRPSSESTPVKRGIVA